jgi:acyl carrier protein
MVLDDCLLKDLDVARFASVIRPKLAGAAALDMVTRDDPLDLFVLFSSVTTVIGTPGQANYIAANAAMEALAERRHAAGLPALAVQWGPIADAGYLTRETRVSDMLAKVLGGEHLRATEALDALPAMLAFGKPIVGLADVGWSDLRGRLPGLATPFWAEVPATARRAASTTSFRAQIAEMTPDEASAVVLDVLIEELARILQQPTASIDVNRPIQEFGVDSLMTVELQTALEGRLGIQMPMLALTSGATLRAIPPRLLQAIQTVDAAAADDLAAGILKHEDASLAIPAPAGAQEP